MENIVDKKYFDKIDSKIIDEIFNNNSFRKELILSNFKCSECLRFYLILTCGKEKIPVLTNDILYTSRYYWLNLFYHYYVREFGEDAGIEQQIGSLIEEMANILPDYDWNLLETLSEDISKM